MLLTNTKCFAGLAIVFFLATTVEAEDVTIKCIQCTSADANCITDLSKFTPGDCTGAKPQCFTRVDTTGIVSRGCYKNDGEATAATCATLNCYLCEKDSCNKNIICKNCDSSKDSDCAKTDATKLTFNSVCAADQTKCIKTVNADKHVIRSCATTTQADCDTATCKTCNIANCNTDIFPAIRLKCYQCADGATCDNVKASGATIKPTPCLLYVADDKCYTFGTDAALIKRGCVSDTDTTVNKCSSPESNEACLACRTSGCNSRDYERDPLMCMQCSTTTSKDCIWAQTDFKKCEKKLLYWQEDTCYTEKLAENGIVRGCFYDRTTPCSAPNCETCVGAAGCNNKEGDFTCIRCRGDTDEQCRKEATKMTGTKCRNAVTKGNDICYYGSWNDVAIRGCLVDADERQKIICNDKKNDQCNICSGVNCNTGKINGAASMKIASSLFVAAFFLLWRLH